MLACKEVIKHAGCSVEALSLMPCVSGRVGGGSEGPYTAAMSELLMTEACWPAWLVVGGPVEGTVASPKAAAKLFSSRLHPACQPP